MHKAYLFFETSGKIAEISLIRINHLLDSISYFVIQCLFISSITNVFMPSVPPTPSNYPARPGTIVDFAILRDFGTRVMSNTEYRFARVLLEGIGREVTASFYESEFARLNGHRGPIRATAGHPVFLRGPTSYMNPDAIEAADAQFARTAERRLAQYDREMLDYVFGRGFQRADAPAQQRPTPEQDQRQSQSQEPTEQAARREQFLARRAAEREQLRRDGHMFERSTTRPEYPDLDTIPHWKPDYAPHPVNTWPPSHVPQPDAILHLENPQVPLIPRNVSKPMPGRFSSFGRLFGRIPVIGTAIAATMAAATGANAREIAEAAARATPLVGTGMALAKGQFEEAGARLVGDFTFGIGEQVLKEALPNSGMEPGLLTQHAAVRAKDLKDPVAVSNPAVWENPKLLKQGEKIRTNHGQKLSESDASKQGITPKI